MIQQSYDLDADALYITVSSAEIVRTVEIDPGTLVDVDAAGGLVGIEVIRPSRTWPLGEILARYRPSKAVADQLKAFFPQPGHDEQAGSPNTAWPIFNGHIEAACA